MLALIGVAGVVDVGDGVVDIVVVMQLSSSNTYTIALLDISSMINQTTRHTY